MHPDELDRSTLFGQSFGDRVEGRPGRAVAGVHQDLEGLQRRDLDEGERPLDIGFAGSLGRQAAPPAGRGRRRAGLGQLLDPGEATGRVEGAEPARTIFMPL